VSEECRSWSSSLWTTIMLGMWTMPCSISDDERDYYNNN
jgi:hypothetical protein